MFVRLLGYIFLFMGYAILSAVIIVPLRLEYEKTLLDIYILEKKIYELTQACDKIKSQISAIDSDPQFAEFLVRKELHIPKPGVETIPINPIPVKMHHIGSISKPLKPKLYILNNVQMFYVQSFLDKYRRVWMVIIGLGMLFSGLVIMFSL